MLVSAWSNNNGRVNNDPIMDDAFLKTPELLKKYGYPAEVHHVYTEDGYILELHRVVKNGNTPVLLVHGLLDSSATWVMMGPDKGLAYLLHDTGYDVWMLNVRGNTYSRNHTRYNIEDSTFWDYTFHEMGKYDLPTTIDYVLQITGYNQLHYIGHSQGTLIFWIMCSERPRYTDKVILMQALAPVAYITHSTSPVVNFIAFFQITMNMLLKLIGANQFLPGSTFLARFSHYICEEGRITEDICTNALAVTTGIDRTQINETMLPVIIGHVPAGASRKQMLHYAQLKRYGHFRQFHYGYLWNKFHYGTFKPPEYKLSNVRNKVALHYGRKDCLATPEDVEHLHLQLPNLVGKFLVNYDEFDHLDFIWAIDVKELLYGKVLRLMDLVERGEL